VAKRRRAARPHHAARWRLLLRVLPLLGLHRCATLALQGYRGEPLSDHGAWCCNTACFSRTMDDNGQPTGFAADANACPNYTPPAPYPPLDQCSYESEIAPLVRPFNKVVLGRAAPRIFSSSLRGPDPRWPAPRSPRSRACRTSKSRGAPAYCRARAAAPPAQPPGSPSRCVFKRTTLACASSAPWWSSYMACLAFAALLPHEQPRPGDAAARQTEAERLPLLHGGGPQQRCDRQRERQG
jgi:hypothetical protein